MADATPPRLLVVVDDDVDARTIESCLKADGFDVEIAADGAVVHSLFDSGPFDLVLLDAAMPNIDVRTVLGEIRERFSPAELPVIILAEHAASKDIVEALDSGANDYVTKPLDASLVRARVGTHLRLIDATRRLDRANRTIEEQNDHIQMVMDSATNAIFALDEAGRFMSANQMTAEVTGRAVADLIGSSFSALVDEANRSEVEELVSKVTHEDFLVSNHDAVFRRGDGDLRTVVLSLRALHHDGEITGVAGIANDVTELRKQSEALAAYIRVLETPDPRLLELLEPEKTGLPVEGQPQTAVADADDEGSKLGQMDKSGQRAHPRHKTYKSGKLFFDNDLSVVDCIVRDQSEGGARLQFEFHFDCPRLVKLRISDRETYNCEVRQFANTIMGVMFLGKA